MPDPNDDASQRRVLALLAAGVLAVALIGVVTGIAPEEYRAQRSPRRVAPEAGNVPPARTHAELERRPWRGGPEASGWTEGRSQALQREEDASDGGGAPTSVATVADAIGERKQRRAFDGAPPVVPHPVRPGGAPECLACHLDGFALAGRRANAIPHPTFSSCTQCHVSSAASLGSTTSSGPEVAGSSWIGLASATSGVIASPGAPPALPHPTWMRERCESCHGPKGRAALRTPHPERRSCLQCHPALSEHGPAGAR